MAEKRKRGRPTKCTPRLIADIAERVSEGISLSRAAVGAGTSAAAVVEWTERGNAGEAPYSEFVKAVNAAEHDFERKNVEVIRRAATEPTITRVEKEVTSADGEVHREVTITEKPPTWQPSAWLLERRFPLHYARLEKRQHDGAIPVAEQGPREVRITLVEPEPKGDAVESEAKPNPQPTGDTDT